MLSLALITLALAALSPVATLVVPRANPPSNWPTNRLEPYDVYHDRYVALGCQTQHGKSFFDLCCHPLLVTQKLHTARPAQCIPEEDDDGDCNDDSTSLPTPTPAPTKPAPAPSTTPKPTKPATTIVPSPAPSPNTGNTAAQVLSGGFATFFYQGGVAGACGTVHSDNDLVAAMDYRRYGDLGAKSSLCGKKVKITNPATKQSVTVVVADACPTCKNENSIDLSLGAFKHIAAESQGMVPIQWSFV